MSSEVNEYLENVIDSIGGCGKFQFLMTFFILGTKMVISWSVLMMSFGGVVPEWNCTWTKDSKAVELFNVTVTKKCSLRLDNSSINAVCSSKMFDTGMKTVVNEWDLVCDREWIISTITTIQMGGLFIGALISGQIGDIVGRRITYFLSVIIVMAGNLAAAFSINWQMFAAFRFCIGMGCGWYLTVFGAFIAELTPKRWRSVVLSVPTWAFGTMSMGLVAWLIHDWKYIQIATAIFCLPWICGFCLIPESYRWLISTRRLEDGCSVIERVAQVNGAPLPDKEKFFQVVKTLDDTEIVSYSFFDILRHRSLLKRLILLSWCWFSCGFGFYAISFGVEQLSGNLYLNMTLLGLMDTSAAIVGPVVNYFGRKWTTLFLFLFAGLTGIPVGVFEMIDFADKGRYINGFALTSKLCVATGWYALWVLTSESYPTVVRNIGFGVNNSLARVGAMISPQLVFASKHIPGLSYIVLGSAFLISTVCVCFLDETNNKGLQDSIEINIVTPDNKQTNTNASNNSDSIKTNEMDSTKL